MVFKVVVLTLEMTKAPEGALLLSTSGLVIVCAGLATRGAPLCSLKTRIPPRRRKSRGRANYNRM